MLGRQCLSPLSFFFCCCLRSTLTHLRLATKSNKHVCVRRMSHVSNTMNISLAAVI